MSHRGIFNKTHLLSLIKIGIKPGLKFPERERAFIQEGLGSTLGLRFSVRNTNASSSIRGNPLVHLIWASLFSVSRNTDTSIVRAATFNPFGPSFMLYTVFNTSISHAGS